MKMISSLLLGLILCSCCFPCLLGFNNTTTTTPQQPGIEFGTLPAVLLGFCMIILLLSIPVIVVVVLLFADIHNRLSHTNYVFEEPDEPIEVYIYKGEKYPTHFTEQESKLAYQSAEIQPLSNNEISEENPKLLS